VNEPTSPLTDATEPNPGSRRTVLVAHPSADLYGSDRVMLATVDALVRSGHEVIVTLPGEGPLCDHIVQTGARVEICPSPVLRKEALRPSGAFRLAILTLRSIRPGWHLIRSTRPGVLYVSTVTIPLWFVLATFARLPSMCHVHEAETGASKLVRRALVLPLLACRLILANSEFSRDVLTESLPRLGPRTRVVPNPVPGPPEVVPARSLLEVPVRAVYLGRLSPRKGPNVAIEAIAELVSRGRDVQLELVGSVFPGYEWYEREVRDLVASRGLGDRVQFSGFHAEVWPRLRAADIVLVPSLSDEPFGNTAVEAILSARPVIVSGAGGLVEAVRGYGSARSVPPGDAVAIADAMEDLVESWSDVRQAASRDAEIAADRHSPERYGNDVTAAVDELAGVGALRSSRLR
jgi:glycosyltransferase involved in cell wall biosynthesis